jgi:very-short-patch-repair endonuclease
METRLRWVLLQADLPRPEVQTDLHDPDGRFVGRADLYFPAARLIVEYDGGNHRERLASDDRRQNLLMNAGFRFFGSPRPMSTSEPTSLWRRSVPP